MISRFFLDLDELTEGKSYDSPSASYGISKLTLEFALSSTSTEVIPSGHMSV